MAQCPGNEYRLGVVAPLLFQVSTLDVRAFAAAWAMLAVTAAAGFSYPQGAEVWQPLAGSPDAREEGWFNLVARLRTDASVTLVVEEAAILLDRLQGDARARNSARCPCDGGTAWLSAQSAHC